MKRARWVVIVLAVVFVVALSAVSIHIYRRHGSNQQTADNEDAYYAAEETLLKYLGVDNKEDDSSDSDEEIVADLTANSRFTQRVTVKDDNDEILPYSGTITKNPESFYPGTYEISFNQEILPKEVTVEVEMDVLKGDEVYILTGDKDSGYTEYAVVTVDKYNTVRFSTETLQTYTLSTTNIAAAQEAMAGIVGD